MNNTSQPNRTSFFVKTALAIIGAIVLFSLAIFSGRTDYLLVAVLYILVGLGPLIAIYKYQQRQVAHQYTDTEKKLLEETIKYPPL